MACGLELRFKPPSRVSEALTSFSQLSNLSGFSSYTDARLAEASWPMISGMTYHFSFDGSDLIRLLLASSEVLTHTRGRGGSRDREL